MGKLTRLKKTRSAPSARSAPQISVLDDHIYLFGGLKDDFNKKLNTVYNDLYRFDTRSNVWEELNPKGNLPPARGFGVAVGDKINNRILVFAGTNYSYDYSHIEMFDDLWRFDLINHVWTKLGVSGDALPRMKRTVAAMVKNKMYIFAGWDFQWYGGTPSADLYGDGPGQIWNEDVYIFDPETMK